MDIVALNNDNKSIINDNSYMGTFLDTSLLVPDFFEYKGFYLPCYSYRGSRYFYYNIGVTFDVELSSDNSRLHYFYRGIYFFFEIASSDGSGGYFMNFPSSLTSSAIENVGKYIAFSFQDYGRDAVVHYIAESEDDLHKFIFDYAIEHSVFLHWVFLSSIEDSGRVGYAYRYKYNYEHGTTYALIQKLACCYPDFVPIVQILGGIPSSNQLANLKSICQLLGVDTSANGLSACELMKEYLKRSNQNLGGTPFAEPNDNLKSICYLLGVDTSENGLSGCELSKDYVKRIGQILGAEYA